MRLALVLPLLALFSLAHTAQQECAPGVTVLVFPRVAEPGVPIQVIVTNNSTEPIMLSSGCTYSAVFPVSDDFTPCTGIPVYRPRIGSGGIGSLPPDCGEDMITLQPNEGTFTAWNQRDNANDQVPLGEYGFSVDIWTDDGDFSCCARVTIADPQPAASVSPRLGSGVNPENLTSDTMPVLGASWDTTLDCSAHAPGLGGFYLKDTPTSGVMLSVGELMVMGKLYYKRFQSHTSSSVSNSLAIPNDVSLWGVRAYAQGVCLGAPGPQLSNALDIVLGC